MTVVSAEAASSPTFAAGVERAPYVSDVTQTSAEVNWATDSQTAAVVQYVDESTGSCPSVWTAGLPTATAVTQSYTVTTTQHQYSAKLINLLPGHSYCYVALSAASKTGIDAMTSPTFQTVKTLLPTGSTAPVSFDVIGDTGENFEQTGTLDGNPTATPFPSSIDPSGVENPYESDLYKEIGQDYADGQAQFLLGAGDLSYSGGTEKTLGDLTQPGTLAEANGKGGTEYSNIFGPTYLPEAGGIPTYFSDGNHGQNANALDAFPMAATAASGAYAMDNYSGVDGITTSSPDVWYAFDTGDVRIYVLDAAWGDNSTGTAGSQYQADVDEHWQPTSKEMTWLQDDLNAQANDGLVKMAIFHYPLVSLNETESSDTALASILDPVLAKGGVSLVFNGHAHTYQRFRPTAAGSIPSYVTGGGGGVPEPVDSNTDTKSTGLCTVEKQVASVYAIGWSPSTSKGSACGSASVPTDVGQVYSYLRVSVANGVISVEGVNADGGTFDPQTYQVSTVTPPTTTTTTTSTTSGSGGGTVKLVTSAGASGATVSLPQAATKGDLLVYSASQYTGATNHITAVSDNAGDKWTLLQAPYSPGGHNSEGELWYTYATGSVSTVTATTKATSIASEVQVFSGVPAGTVPASGSGSADSNAASSSASGSGLEVGFVAGHGNSEAITLGAGLTPQPQVPSAAGTSISTLITGYETTSGTGTFSGTFPTAMYWASGVAVFPAG